MQQRTLSLSDPNRRATAFAIGGLGITQIVGWGTSFSTLPIFGTVLSADLGLGREVIFGGLTLMLLVSALVSARVGGLVDRLGARPVMVTGSFIAALAMAVQSRSVGLVSYMIPWVLIGIASPMMLSNSAMPGLVQVVGPNARRAITALTLMSGLTGTVFLPLNKLLLDSIGWREAYLVFAVMHVFICAPIHYLVLNPRGGRAQLAGAPTRAAPPPDGLLAPAHRRRAFVLMAIWACTEGLITWGLYIQIIDIFKAAGLSDGVAIGLWAIVGPAQAAARFTDLVLGGRLSILTIALASAVLTSASFLAFAPFGVSFWPAVLFCACMGLGHGLFAIARNALPLALFGAREFGHYLGLLTVPQSIVNAAAPIIFAALISRVDPTYGLWLAATAACLGFVAVSVLVSFCRRNADFAAKD